MTLMDSTQTKTGSTAQMTKVVVGAFSVALLTLAGCKGGGARAVGPYTPVSEAMRDTAKAERLTREAADLIDTNPTRAEELLRAALTADLYHGPAHNNLGVLYLNQDKLYEAAGEFEWAKKLLPGHPDPRMNLALVFESAGRTDEALATYATALEVYPEHLPSMQALARLQVRTGKRDERTPRMLREIALRGESDTWRDWARFQLAKAGE